MFRNARQGSGCQEAFVLEAAVAQLPRGSVDVVVSPVWGCWWRAALATAAAPWPWLAWLADREADRGVLEIWPRGRFQAGHPHDQSVTRLTRKLEVHVLVSQGGRFDWQTGRLLLKSGPPSSAPVKRPARGQRL
jgi:hypothetical protein